MSATAGLTTKREAGAAARAETCFLSIDWRMVCILVDGVEEEDVDVLGTEILWRICGSQSLCARFRSGRRLVATRLRFCGPERASVEDSDCVVEKHVPHCSGVWLRSSGRFVVRSPGSGAIQGSRRSWQGGPPTQPCHRSRGRRDHTCSWGAQMPNRMDLAEGPPIQRCCTSHDTAWGPNGIWQSMRWRGGVFSYMFHAMNSVINQTDCCCMSHRISHRISHGMSHRISHTHRL